MADQADRIGFTPPYPRAVCIDNLASLAADSEGKLREPGPGDRYLVSLTIGRVYEVRGKRLGMWAILDDTGDVYLFPKANFRFLRAEEPPPTPPPAAP